MFILSLGPTLHPVKASAVTSCTLSLETSHKDSAETLHFIRSQRERLTQETQRIEQVTEFTNELISFGISPQSVKRARYTYYGRIKALIQFLNYEERKINAIIRADSLGTQDRITNVYKLRSMLIQLQELVDIQNISDESLRDCYHYANLLAQDNSIRSQIFSEKLSHIFESQSHLDKALATETYPGDCCNRDCSNCRLTPAMRLVNAPDYFTGEKTPTIESSLITLGAAPVAILPKHLVYFDVVKQLSPVFPYLRLE